MPDGALRSAWKRDVLDDPALAGGVRDAGVQPDLVRSLAGYFANPVKATFAGAATPSGPAFFRRCWEACRAIPPGRTASYAWLAEQAGGGPYAARAAGQ